MLICFASLAASPRRLRNAPRPPRGRGLAELGTEGEAAAGKQGAPPEAAASVSLGPTPGRRRFSVPPRSHSFVFRPRSWPRSPTPARGVCACARGGRRCARRAGALPPRTRLALCPPAALGGKAVGRQWGCEPKTPIPAAQLPPPRPPGGIIYIRATCLNFHSPPSASGRTRAGSEREPARARADPRALAAAGPGAQTGPGV